MHSRHLLTLGPDIEPLWVPTYIHEIDEVWPAMLVAKICLRRSRMT